MQGEIIQKCAPEIGERNTAPAVEGIVFTPDAPAPVEAGSIAVSRPPYLVRAVDQPLGRAARPNKCLRCYLRTRGFVGEGVGYIIRFDDPSIGPSCRRPWLALQKLASVLVGNVIGAARGERLRNSRSRPGEGADYHARRPEQPKSCARARVDLCDRHRDVHHGMADVACDALKFPDELITRLGRLAGELGEVGS